MKTWGILVSNAGISEFRPRSGRLAFRRVSAGPPDPGDRASIAGKDSMSFLNNVDSKFIVAGFGTFAVFGSLSFRELLAEENKAVSRRPRHP